MIFPDLNTTKGQVREISRAIQGLPSQQAWDSLKHIGDLLRPKRIIVDTDVRHAIAIALLKVKGRAA